MARKTSYVTINDTGRDKGKVFFLTEMSATQAEKWAVRTLLAMARGGVELPNGILREGIMGIAVLGVINMMKIPFAEAEPLMVEMFQCIKCNKKFKTNQILNNHLNRKIPCDRKLECNRCKKEFKTKFKLNSSLKNGMFISS